MAVDLLGYTNLNDRMAIQEAASAGLKSMEHLIRAVSYQQQQHHQIQPLDCREIADFAVSNFNKVITILNRTGHARFRRAPIQPPSLFSLPPAPSQPGAGLGKDEGEAIGKEGLSLSAAVSTSGNSSSTFVSSITGEGSVSNGKGGSPPTFAVPPISASKPPLSGKRCREHNHSDYISGKTSGSSRCHCKKRCVPFLIDFTYAFSFQSEVF